MDATKGVAMRKIKCAIYVRKSTEKGLELEFNSLHNQEEACRNYILSQAFQGWEYHKTYTDGGISGGTMDRPALKQMMDDMARGHIQVVVVYKVDRLSRSIMDFHNMMKEFDRRNCNFVSITQSFDTSTSMGKLTLNMLLSFAQFEREVSSERVRDKIRASKAKGIWTGGYPPLGYDIINKKLVVNPVESETLRSIFEKYLELKSLLALRQWTIDNDIKNKKWMTGRDYEMGGSTFSVHALNNMLRHPVYIGKIRNKATSEIFDGQHEAIVPAELFGRVQQQLTGNNNRNSTECRHGRYMLHRKIFDMAGNRCTNQSGSKKSTKFGNRYYCLPGKFLPAGDIERVTCEAMQELLDSYLSGVMKADILHGFKSLDFTIMTYETRTKLLHDILDKVVYSDSRLTYYVRVAPVAQGFRADGWTNQNIAPLNNRTYASADGKFIIIEKDIVINNRISTNKYEACGRTMLTVKENNSQLIRALAYGWRYKQMYESGVPVDHIQQREKIGHRTVYKYLNLAYLSPRIIGSILDSNCPPEMDLQKLFQIASAHTDFKGQEFAFFA
jgi:DNA invertase Pin-like site-specific DNA recombinase